jgi:hypothetical protein
MNFSHLTNYVVALGFCLFLALELVFLQACISLAYDALYLRKLASLFLYPHLDRGLFVVTLRALKFLRHLTGPKFSVLHATSRTLICPQPSAGIPRQPTPSFFQAPLPRNSTHYLSRQCLQSRLCDSPLDRYAEHSPLPFDN